MKVLVTGGTGMVGQAFGRLTTNHEIVLVGSKNYDLRVRKEAFQMINDHQPDAIIHLAARVGGVKGNTDFVADFFSENVQINTNVLDAAKENNDIVKKVVSLLSTCVYPDKVNYPLTPDQIHNGPSHPSNFGYAYAKRMLAVHTTALRQQYGCNFIAAIPNNIFGPGDNFHLDHGHVIPAIIRKVFEAKYHNKEVVLWATGRALREFTYSDDVADILMTLLDNYDSGELINIGKTTEYSIREVARIICEIFDYDFNLIHWDSTKPEGQFRKPSDNSVFLEKFPDFEYTNFSNGLSLTCEWFIKNYPNIRGL